MGIDTSYLGRSYQPTESYQVSRAKIAEFALAIGAASPLHTDVAAAQDAGYPDVIAPPTFAVVIAQRAEHAYYADPQAGIDFSRVVHAEETFTYSRPLTAGDEIEARLVVTKIVARASIAMVTTRVELATTAGEAVATVTSTLVIRGQ